MQPRLPQKSNISWTDVPLVGLLGRMCPFQGKEMVSIHPFWEWRGPLSVSADVGGSTWERVSLKDRRSCCPRGPGRSLQHGCDIGEVAGVTQPIGQGCYNWGGEPGMPRVTAAAGLQSLPGLAVPPADLLSLCACTMQGWEPMATGKRISASAVTETRPRRALSSTSTAAPPSPSRTRPRH